MCYYFFKKVTLLIVLLGTFIEATAQLPALIPYRKGSKWGYANAKKKIIIEPVYDSVTTYSEGRASFLKEGKWGSLDEQGNIVVEPKYATSLFFYYGVAKITVRKDSTDLYGYIDDKGTVIIEPQYDLLYQLRNRLFMGRVSVKRNRSSLMDRFYGLWDSKGKVILPPVYQNIGTFNNGIAKIEKDNKYGYMDSAGNWLIQPGSIYNSLEPFSNGLGAVRRTDPQTKKMFYEYIDTKGKVVHNGKQYAIAEPYIGGFAKVFLKKNEDDLMTTRLFVDINGKEINVVLKGDRFIDRQVENGFLIKRPVYPAGYTPGLADNEDYKHATHYLEGFMDYKGQTKEEPVYDKIQVLNDKFLMGRTKGKWVLINTKSQAPIAQSVFYDTILLQSNGYLKLRKDKKWGCADSSGKIILPMKYDTILSIDKSTISLALNKKYGCVDFTGKPVVPLKYDYIGAMENGVVVFMIANKIGIVNNKGKEIVPAKYEPRPFRVYTGATVYLGMNFSKGIVMVSYKGKQGYIDNTGKEYWED